MTSSIQHAHLLAEGALSQKALFPAKVLVIDDDPLILGALVETLRREGHDVLKAADGQEALQLMSEHPIALIICDQKMPVISGAEILQHAQRICPDAVRIALTGATEREVVVNAINVGQVSQFISKPWEDVVLHQVVVSSLEKYRLSMENKVLQHLLFSQNKTLEKVNQALRYEMELGAKIHKELLLGKVPSAIQGLSFAATTIPSREIDGDFFDFHHLNPYIIDVVIGDVMGKGIPAALVGTAVKSTLQRFAVPLTHVKYCDRKTFWLDDLSTPGDIIVHTHLEIARQLVKLEFFVCLFYGRFDLVKKTFRYVDCGSTKPLHFKCVDNAVNFLRGEDYPLGMVENCNYHELETPFQEGDSFIFYSDGLTESRSPDGELYGVERLVSLVKECGNGDAETILQTIKQSVLNFSQRDYFDDDLTLLVVKLSRSNPFHPRESISAVYLNDLSQLSSVRSFVKRVCDDAPGDVSALLQALELAVDESFCNIVQHSYKERPNQTVYLRAEYQNEGLWIELTDQGESFNPISIPEPSLAGCEEGGYGLYMIRRLADQLVYIPKSTPEGWNHLRIYKRYIFKEVPMEFTHTTQDKVLVVTPTGPSLDAREAREFKEKIMNLIGQNESYLIVIDMCNLQFIDSSGLGTFLSILKLLHAQGGELKLAHLNKPIRTIFELVSMHKIFEIYNTLDEAILSFK